MLAKIQKWGNSLALRIPTAFAKDVRLTTGCEVEITMNDGKLIIAPVPAPNYSLAVLLQSVTDQNRHAEIDTGDAVGREVW